MMSIYIVLLTSQAPKCHIYEKYFNTVGSIEICNFIQKMWSLTSILVDFCLNFKLPLVYFYCPDARNCLSMPTSIYLWQESNEKTLKH